MWKFCRSIGWSAVKEFWTASDRVLSGTAVVFFFLILLNRTYGEHLITEYRPQTNRNLFAQGYVNSFPAPPVLTAVLPLCMSHPTRYAVRETFLGQLFLPIVSHAHQSTLGEWQESQSH
jgi:hypothetical protein